MLADPCSAIFAQADVARAAGMPIVKRSVTPAGSSATCSYETGRPGHSVLVTVFETSSPDEATVKFEQDASSNQRLYVAPAVPVANLGDEAKAFGHTLWVRKRNVIFVINVIDVATRGATLDRAKALARAALARIPPSTR